MTTVDTTERVGKLRELMKGEGVDVYIVPSEDSHQSEYIAPCDARRAYICGFTGSAGTAVITLDKAVMATDGRYFNQAAKQLDGNWELLKQGLEDVPTWQVWTADQTVEGKKVGVDPTLITASAARELSQKIKKKGGSGLVGVKTNLVDKVWGDARPPRPREKINLQPLEFTGKALGEKIEELRKELEKKKSAGLIVSMLDEVAWLYNLRGNDIPYNPVFFSYAIVTPTSATLYVDSSKFSPEVLSHLGDKVQIRPYDSILDDVTLLKNEPEAGNKARTDDAPSSDKPPAPKRKFMISSKTSWALSLELGGEDQVDEVRSPVGDAKAIKNDVEIAGMRACHVRDGAALTAFFAWVEDTLLSSNQPSINEVQVADRLTILRSKQSRFAGLSFPTISSVGPNAAVIHYKPEPNTCSTLDPDQIYLCDSGGQYQDGTTDTTRTLHFGTPTLQQKRAYTLVLKGVISIATAIFPKGTTGFALDSFARRALWAEGMDYRHGTGHGVGSYLNVHEGPIGIGTRAAYSEVALSKGNVISDEPGYYVDGGWGIRIENIVVVKEIDVSRKLGAECAVAAAASAASSSSKTTLGAGGRATKDADPNGSGEATTPSNGDVIDNKEASDTTDHKASKDKDATATAADENGDSDNEDEDRKPFLTFETVTMVPLCRKLIHTPLLTAEEVAWIDEYHALVRENVRPLLEATGDEVAIKWLERETEGLGAGEKIK